MRKITPIELRKHFMESLYSTLESVISPTPYLALQEGEKVEVQFLDGRGRLPRSDTTEMTILDIDTASLFFDDFNVLWEGVTGTGKSYTADALGNTVCGKDGYLNLTLSSGALGTSAVEPFTRTELDNGIPKTRIDREKCAKYGILFLDEINAGDFKDTSRVVEGVAQVNGDIEYLRIPIPGTDRYKKLAIIAAMNPSDALHSHAQELTIAGENRFLKFRFPNGVCEAGSSQLEKKLTGDLHEQFWNEFREKTGLKGSWKELYPLVTDPEQVSSELDGETREFIDVALGYAGYDPRQTYEKNAQLMKDGGLSPNFSISNDNNLEKIVKAQNALKHGFVRRDLQKISDLSRLLGFIKSVKKGTYNPDVSVNDATASIGLVLESKAVTGTDYGTLMTLANAARTAYSKLHKELQAPQGLGIRQIVLDAAIYSGQQHGFSGYQNTLRQGIEKLNKQTEEVANATIRSRLLGDLVVLDHFSQTYEDEVATALKEKDEKVLMAIRDIYKRHKSQSSVYEHRLSSMVR